jgi:hypothetical protein
MMELVMLLQSVLVYTHLLFYRIGGIACAAE